MMIGYTLVEELRFSSNNVEGGNGVKQCPNCSTKNQDNAAFCENCGTDLRNVAAMPNEKAATAGDFLNRAKEATAAGAKKAKETAKTGAAKVKAFLSFSGYR